MANSGASVSGGRRGDSLSEDGNMLMAFQTLASSAQWEMAGGDQSH